MTPPGCRQVYIKRPSSNVREGGGSISTPSQPRPPVRRSGRIPALPYPPNRPTGILPQASPARKPKIKTARFKPVLGLSRIRLKNVSCCELAERWSVTKSVFTTRYDQFRHLLVEARKEAGLTQVDLAKKLSRPQSFVSKFERGERRLDVIEFLDIAEALNVDPYKFLSRVARQPQPRKKATG